MSQIKRTFKTYEVRAYTMSDTVPPEVIEHARIAVLDTSMNERKARIAMRDANVVLPKHCMVTWNELEEVTYVMDIDTFIKNASIDGE